MTEILPNFQEYTAHGGQAERLPDGGWRLSLPPGDEQAYRVAQIDDYSRLGRRAFPWQAPTSLRLCARASGRDLPGTWGFGLWNDPFSMGVLGGGRVRLPALPNTAWFFFASPPNYLSLRDDRPAAGQLAAAFRAPPWPTAWMAAGALALPLLALPPAARLLRRLGRPFLRQAASALDLDPTEWHTYQIDWQPGRVRFTVDERLALQTGLAPRGRLGLVIWIDNQYMALPPTGRAAYGWLANPPAWIEAAQITIHSS